MFASPHLENPGDRLYADASQRFKINSGEDLLKQHDDCDTDTGGAVNRWFCSKCGSPIQTRSFRVPGIVIVSAGLFDEAWDWKIDYEQWRKSKMSFVAEFPGLGDSSKYNEFPDKSEFERVLAKL